LTPRARAVHWAHAASEPCDTSESNPGHPHIGYSGANPGGGTVPTPKSLPGAPNCLYNPQQLAQDGRRALSYGLREVSRLLLAPYPEFAGALTCGVPMRHIPGDDVEVALYHDPEGGHRVGFHGLMTCSSPWVCPVCSPKLAAQRGEALARALAHFHAAGLWVAHAVLTVQHTRGEALADVFGALADAWRRMTKSREFRPHWSGLGYARGVEVTLGPNGWHPHIHLAVVIPPDRDPYALEEALWEAWSGAVLEVGWAPSSRGAYSYQVARTEADIREVGRYVSKAGSGWGLGPEVAGGARKQARGGMSPFQLLGVAWAGYLEDPEGMASWFPQAGEDFSLGGLGQGGGLIIREFCRAASERANRLGVTPQGAAWRWLEYAEATKARKALTSSRALGLVLKAKLAEVEAEAQNAVPIEVIWLSRRVYIYLLRTAQLARLVHLAEALGSLRRACEMLGLVEGDEYTLPPANAPPLSPEGEGERVLSPVQGAG